ncbi:MAG: electron transfer flavoprotein subunit beta/FixA family protein [Desulfobacterales bacterium]
MTSINSIVCIKSVVLSAPDGVGRRTAENSDLNPFDRPALEAALGIKKAQGGTVTALTMGPEVGVEALAEAKAMGVDGAVLISDPALAQSDTLITARVLAAAIDRLTPYAFVFFGTRSSDSDTGQVGPQTATLLRVPFVSGVRRMQPESDAWEITRLMDEWEETWRIRGPAAVTIHAGSFPPKPVSLPGIAQAYDGFNVRTWSLADLGLSAGSVGLTASPTRVAALRKVKRQRTCRMLEGEPAQQAEALMKCLAAKGLTGS